MQSTPSLKGKKRRSGSAILSPQFSEVEVSPGRSPTQGNLTGLPRKVKDGSAEWYNCVHKWQSLGADGLNIINEISNIKLEAIFEKDQLAEREGCEPGEVDMPVELQPLIDKLQTIWQSMEKVLKKMAKITLSMKGIADLEYLQLNESYSSEPLFQTWTTDRFYEHSKELLEMYQKELPLKQTILQNIAHATKRDLLMVYTAAWLHEPYITDQGKLILESMLKETGHK